MAIPNFALLYPRLPGPLLAMAGFLFLIQAKTVRAAARLSNSFVASNYRTPLWPDRQRHLTSKQRGCARGRPFTQTW